MSKVQKPKPNPLSTPYGFARAVFGHDFWELQEQILHSAVTNRNTFVKSCHSSGKTFLAGDLVLYWIQRYPSGIALTTAPGWLQVEKQLWGEIRNTLKTSKVKYPEPNLTELKISDRNYALGISTKEATRFQGFKGSHVLIILDEAPGVTGEIWEALEGLKASGSVHILALGNPTIIGGAFTEAFTIKRHTCSTFTISAFDTPNLADHFLEWEVSDGKGGTKKIRVGKGTKNLLELTNDELDICPRPYLCSPRWVRDMYLDWGPTHPYFESRVLGEFPTESADTLVPLSWLERQKNVVPEPKKKPGKIYGGLDVAGPGEAETSLTLIRDGHVFLQAAWPREDPRGEIVAILDPIKNELASLNVDSIGVGWGIYLHLADLYTKSVVHPINVGKAPRDSKRYANAKAEYYWACRLRIRDGELTGITDEMTIGQLSAIKYEHDSRGKIVIEDKESMRKRGVKSPDRAESLMLAQASPQDAQSQLFEMSLVTAGADLSVNDDDPLVQRSKWR